MAIIKCKMCGGDLNLVEGASTAECEFCGSIQTVPQVDDEKKLTLFARANRLRIACEFDKAAGIYEAIVADFPEEAEAYWGLVLCKYGIEYVDDPATGKRVPTCHRSSFDSILEDSDFEQALENADLSAKKVYRQEAKEFERIRKGILEVSSSEKPYDIFICYKETDEKGDRTLDSVIAQDLYGALTDKGYRVFFSRITLQGKLGEAYEPYIFAALTSAKVMLVVGTCYEYYTAVWVRNEWSRYLKICEADKGKHLIPCYKNLDPEDMPKEFHHLQGADLGKMGAVQDILFNMEKYIPTKKENTVVVQEKVVAVSNPTVETYLKRVSMFLEDKDWTGANEYCEKVLDLDPENAHAYLGKLMVEMKVCQQEQLQNCSRSFENSNHYRKILRYGGDPLKATLQQYLKLVQKRVNEETENKKKREEFLRCATIQNGELTHYSGSQTVIVLPDTITRIGESAFWGCSSLTGITIPNSVKSIGEFAFAECSRLTGITIPNSVTRIEENAFYGCSSLTGITIPNSVTSIGPFAFQGCSSLTGVTIPTSVTSIDDHAFEECSSLTSITLPNGVENLGCRVFSDCINLTKIVVDADHKHYCSDATGALFSKDQSTLICVPAGSSGHYRIPKHVRKIANNAFENCSKLTDITIPEGVTDIGNDAFNGCTGLSTLSIPDSVVNIGESICLRCANLTKIIVSEDHQHYCSDAAGALLTKDKTCLLCVPGGLRGHYEVPDEVKQIGIGAFCGCHRITGVTLPNTIFRIEDWVFSECSSLTEITIPNSVKSIGECAFNECTSLTAITIPDGVRSIEECAFCECTGLKYITIPDSVTSIDSSSFVDCNTQKLIIYASPASVVNKMAQIQRITVQEDPKIKRARDEQCYRQAAGLCQHCGGPFKGLFTKKCADCGKPKDY